MNYVRLGDLCVINSGGTPRRNNESYWKNGDIPWVKISDLKNEIVESTEEFITLDGLNNSSAKIFPKGTLLYTIFATIGEVAILKMDAATNQAIVGIQLKENKKVYLKYIYYYLKSQTNNIKQLGRGVAQNNINLSVVKNMIIPIVSLEKQRNIIATLNKLEKIKENRITILNCLDDLIKSRFDEFNKFNTHVKNLKLEDVCTSIVRGPFGSALKVDSFVKKSDKSVKVYEQSNAIQKSATIGSRYISKDHYESLKRFKCKPGDIIMSCSGTIGRLFILPSDAEEGIINQALCKFTLGKILLPEIFLLYMDILIGNIETKGSGIKNISAVKFIKNLEIPVPPIGAQNKLLFELNQINKLKSDVQKSIDETQLLMDSLMQEYFG